MRPLLSAVALLATCLSVNAQTIVYQQPPASCGALYQSSWWDPDGSDYDQYIWDNFTLSSNQAITQIHWRGGFIYGGSYGGPVLDFRVAIYASIAGGSQPDVVNPPLVQYLTGGNANQTNAGVSCGITMYDYALTLPSPFQAIGGVKYWLKLYAYQHGIPEWGLAAGTGGDGHYFRYLTGGPYYQLVNGDTTFSLYASTAPTFTITATASPANAGVISGAGDYPAGSLVSLTATPNAGFGFVNWTENGTQVSTNAHYTFTATANRTLVAQFTNAFTVTTSVSPGVAGTSTGGGVFNSGSGVTVAATASAGFVFVNWTEFGSPVSNSASYTFTVTADRTLVANFVTDPLSVFFDFDNAPVHTSLPIDVTVGGLTAHLSATGQGFSIQPAGTMGFTPAGFAGLCIYPNSINAADLLVGFSDTLTAFSIMYAPQELGCDTSATMRVTAYMNGTLVGTNTTTAPVPGTWPTGTLSIVASAGFNNVVVHYDSRPPTCADWGPIFLADNMIVTRLAGAPIIGQQPMPVGTCTSGSAVFTISASGAGTLAYQWQGELDPGIWTDLADGSLLHNSIVLATISGAMTSSLQIASLTHFLEDRGLLGLRCAVSNTISGTTSDVVMLTVWPTGSGDANADGLTNGNDVQRFVQFIVAGGPPGAGNCACDFTGDGLVDANDAPGFVSRLLGL